MILTVPVTQEHMSHGKAGNCRECPVALAICDALRIAGVRFKDVTVSGYIEIRLRRWLRLKRVMPWPPAEVNAFIRSFDGGRDVQPFTFQLEADL